MKMGTRTGLWGTGRKEKGKYEEAILEHGDGRNFGSSYVGGLRSIRIKGNCRIFIAGSQE